MTDIKRLANKINRYFVGLTDHFPPLCQGVPPLSVPDELLISEYEAYKSLSSLQTWKAVGPDNLVCGIYNQSLREGYIPALLKIDLIHHSILMQELADLEFHPVILSWIAAFLTSRKQAT